MGRRLVSSLSIMARQNCPDDLQDIAQASEMEGFPDRNWMHVSRTVFAGLQGTLLILGILINSLICYVMLRRRKIHKSTANFYLFHLSLTELILWLVVLPVCMVVQMSQADSVVPCKVLIFVVFTCEAVMFGLLTAIAVDKYTNIVNPFKGLVLEERKVLSVVCVWIYAVVTSASFLYSVQDQVLIFDLASSSIIRKSGNEYETIYAGSNATGFHNTTTLTGSNTSFSVNVTLRNTTRNFSSVHHNTSCTFPLRICDIPSNLEGQLSCTLYFIFSFLFPLILITAAYSKIVHRLWLRSRASDAQGTAAKAKLRAVRMLVLVVLTYLITNGPWVIAFLLYTYRPSELLPFEKHYTVISIVTTLFYASSVLSPAVAAVHSATVQQEIARIVCCRGEEGTSGNSSLAPKAYRSIKSDCL